MIQTTHSESDILKLELSDGAGSHTSEKPAPAAQAEPLSQEETQALLDRLPPMKAEAQESEFSMRKGSRPAPRAGKTIKEHFPPKEDRAAPNGDDAGPLEVLRITPQGKVDLAHRVSVTFSQPMTALTSHDDLKNVRPVHLTPQPEEGEWRWLGTRGLVFDGPKRLPMATQYKVTVPAGTASANGGALKEAVEATFSTPPAAMTAHWPDGHLPHAEDTLFFLAFDQDMDPQAVVDHVQITANGQTFKVRTATAEEVTGDANLKRYTENHHAKRQVAFRTLEPLPLAARVTVKLPAGLPSAEGPLTTQSAQQFQFSTRAPLKVTKHQCGWNNNCTPGTPWEITFNNQLDVTAYSEAWFQVEPQVPGMTGSVYANRLSLRGLSNGRTTYKVTLSPEITDQFGQKLGKPVELTFKVGDASERMFSPGGEFQVLDPTAKPQIPVYTTNHQKLRVRLYVVGPRDWSTYQKFMQDRWRNTDAKPPGELALDQEISPGDDPNQLLETMIDLKPALHKGLGQVFVRVSSTKPPPKNRPRPEIVRWVQVTRIAMDAFCDQENLHVWTGSLEDGKPLSNLTLELYDADGKKSLKKDLVPDAMGMTQLGLTLHASNNQLLVAYGDNDLCILPESTAYWGGSNVWNKRPRKPSLTWHVFNDRGMYKPGEKVHIKGWIRRVDGKTGPEAANRGKELTWHVSDARKARFAEGTATLSEGGGFHLSLDIPDDVNLGQAQVFLSLAGKVTTSQLFKIQEFRRPEYEVTVKTSPGPHFAGEAAWAEVKAAYYAGGGLPDADAHWNITATEASYTPPNLDKFTFGHWLPWWRGPWNGKQVSRRHQGATDQDGVHRLRMDLEDPQPATARKMDVAVSVRDENNQQWSASTSFLAHAASRYVGLRSERYFVDKGQPFFIEAVAADIDGSFTPGAVINVLVTRTQWVFRGGQWKEEEKDPQEFELTMGDKPVTFQFKTPEGGSYRIAAHVRDEQGRLNETRMVRWVSGGDMKPTRRVELEEVTLIPDRREYQPGETAKILIMAPFENAEGLLTLDVAGIEKTERFTLKGNSGQLSIPIEDLHMPNVHVKVDLTGAAPRRDHLGQPAPELPTRPAHATGALDLSVPPLKRELNIALVPENKALSPGASTWLDIEVTDAQGQPSTDAELVVFAVDEAVLALSSYQLSNPLNTFHPKRGKSIRDQRLRNYVVLADPDLLRDGGASNDGVYEESAPVATAMVADAAPPAPRAQTMRMKAARPGAPAAQAKPIAIRTDFNPLAAWFPEKSTDARGRLRVKIDLPDNLTRYRLMAVAVSGVDRFGKGEASLTARLPLMVRPSAPRFLNFGDQFSFPVLVQNLTDQPREVVLAARAQNAAFTEGAGRKVTVPARNRVNVFFPVKTERVGSAVFQIAVSSGDFADAARVEIPVHTPATSEAFAVYGELDEGTLSQPVAMPDQVFPQFGGLEITTSSTALQSLTDAMLYLTDYPYECAEQRASRILAVSALEDMLKAFGSAVNPKALRHSVEADIKMLQRLQNPDGGWGFWRKGERSQPYLSVHATYALTRAQDRGFQVSDQSLNRAKNHLTRIDKFIPRDWGKNTRYSIRAYAAKVLAAMGQQDSGPAMKVFSSMPVDQAPMEGLAWLLPLLPQAQQQKVFRQFNNRVTETAAAATFATSYGDDAWLVLHSKRRTDGIILDALVQVDPTNDLIPKVMRGLMDGRRSGRWLNTQENVFILMAMEQYFRAYEKEDPNFVARVWLGDDFAGEQTFKGRSGDYRQLDIPMAWLAEKGDANLLLAHEGEGRLYYRLGMRYAPQNLDLEPAAHGFFVERTYEAVDHEDDVTRMEDGTWVVKQGATVRVRLTMTAPSRRHHVALIDPLPAGLEAVNPDLAVTPVQPEPTRPGKRVYRWWRPTWYVHQNMRDERVEAFAHRLWAGVFEYSYLARATTPGSFVTPPAKAEEMYHPETFGRSASNKVVVK